MIFILIQLGCSHKRYENGHGLEAADLGSDVKELWPAEFRLISRVILTFKGQRIDLTSYLLFRQPALLYASAFAEMGAAVFEFKAVNGRSQVLKSVGLMGSKAIEQGIVADLIHLYSSYRSDHQSMVPSFFYKENRLSKSQLKSSGSIVSEFDYFYSSKWEDLPASVHIKNFKYSYELDIEHIDLRNSLPARFDEMLEAS